MNMLDSANYSLTQLYTHQHHTNDFISETTTFKLMLIVSLLYYRNQRNIQTNYVHFSCLKAIDF